MLAGNFSDLNKIRVLVLKKIMHYRQLIMTAISTQNLAFPKYFQIFIWTFIISILLKSIYDLIEAKNLFRPCLGIMIIRIKIVFDITFFFLGGG